MQKNKLYIIVSEQLSPIYGCVQGGHAVAQWLLEHPNQSWNNSYLIYVKADVQKIMSLLQTEDISYFCEPDLNNELTAIAVQETESNRKILRKLKLFK